jgi:hypothetical protein
MPCHHALAELLHAYISAAGIADHRKGWLFRTSSGHNSNVLSDQAMDQSAAWRMIRRRAAAACGPARDRALMAVMTYTFARISAVGMRIEDYFANGKAAARYSSRYCSSL